MPAPQHAVTMPVLSAASDVWKAEEGEPGDSYTWVAVDIPKTHGHVVQLTAGEYHGTCLSAIDHEAFSVHGWLPGVKQYVF